MIITFCGHGDYSPSKEHEKMIFDFLEEKIGGQLAELYLGGYGNFDSFAYRCGEIYQVTHPNTKLFFVTPYLTRKNQKDRLEYVKKRYDGIIYPPLEKIPPRFAILHRNRWMVEQADCVIAYVTHKWGGAYRTLQHAKRRHKEICDLSAKS